MFEIFMGMLGFCAEKRLIEAEKRIKALELDCIHLMSETKATVINGSNIMYTNNLVEDWDGCGIIVTSNASDCVISGNWFKRNYASPEFLDEALALSDDTSPINNDEI